MDGPGRADRDRSDLTNRVVPEVDRRSAVGWQLRVEVRELHPTARRRRPDPALHLLARLGEELVHRPDPAGRREWRATRGCLLASTLRQDAAKLTSPGTF